MLHFRMMEKDNLPDWLKPEPIDLKNNPVNRRLSYALAQSECAAMFEPTLDKLAMGMAVSEIIRESAHEISCAEFLRWVHKDPTRKARYYEAQEIGAEVVASEMITIADGVNSLEDVQRSKLRIDTRKFLLGVWNRKRYGEVKQVEMTGTISITEALAQAQARIIEAEVVDVVTIENTQGDDNAED